MRLKNSPVREIFIIAILWIAAVSAAQDAGPRPDRLQPPMGDLGTLTHIPCEAAGPMGVAVRVLVPDKPRFKEGAPVVIHVQGGVAAGAAGGRPEFVGHGFVEVFFAFPGGGRGEAASGGNYDLRGPNCIRALANVIRFATGRLADKEGRKIDDLTKGVTVLKNNCGLIGSSNGGNACGMVMALHGDEFPDLAFYASMESPYGEGMVNAEHGGFEGGTNPAYNPETGVLDLSKLAWSTEVTPGLARRPMPGGTRLSGGLFFDLDGDGKFSAEKDFPANTIVGDAGAGVRSWYSPRLLAEANRRKLIPEPRPVHVPTLEESNAFWRFRDAAGSIKDAVKKCRNVAVIVYAGEKDHVQAAPDHAHIVIQAEGFRRAGAKFIRLNPDRSYVQRLIENTPLQRFADSLPDNDAGKACEAKPAAIRAHLEPTGIPIGLYMQAAVCELADRVQVGDWSANLDRVLYPDAPRAMRPLR